MKPSVLAATLFLSLVAIVHLVRLVLQVPINAGNTEISMWVSVFGVAGPGALAVWLWREQQR